MFYAIIDCQFTTGDLKKLEKLVKRALQALKSW